MLVVSATPLAAKLAVTDWAADIVTTQAPVPLHAPVQPVNAEPEAGVAVSVTAAPDEYEALQVLPQLMPAGEELTVPEPFRLTPSA